MTVTVYRPMNAIPSRRVAVRSALSGLMPEQKIEIKWPNDVIIWQEMWRHPLRGQGGVAAIGIGINVNRSEWPDDLVHRAVSMKQAAGETFSVDEVKRAVIEKLCDWRKRISESVRPGAGRVPPSRLLDGHVVFDEKETPAGFWE
jgi:biotin-(acetyl-CoA carboxylase) ligase